MNFYRVVLLITVSIFLSISINDSRAASIDSDRITLSPIGVTPKGNTVSVATYNGRFWSTLNKENKGVLICGLMEGVKAYFIKSDVASAPNQKKYREIKDSFFAEGFYPPEIANIVDTFYEDSSCIKIPIFELVIVAVKKTEGATPQKIDGLLTDLRKKYNN